MSELHRAAVNAIAIPWLSEYRLEAGVTHQPE